jgi:hypothetical protein
MCDNKFIHEVDEDGKWLCVTYYDGRKIRIPQIIGSKQVTLKDPYDPRSNNGCMVANKITYSKLSTYAKQAFTVLRSWLCYGTDFTFITMDVLAEGMSCTRQKAKDAVDELAYFGVIAVERTSFNGLNKNYFLILPINQWKLPSDKNEWKRLNKEREAA